MAANNLINLKVFLRDDSISEARRFTVDASVVTSFLFMKEKLQTVFPTLRDSDFKITWKDADGDEITIASDEDFITAFTEMSGNVKILYVTVIQRNPEPAFVIDVDAAPEATYRGPRVICDVCNQQITGFRYKCMQCPDYDLCTGCEHQGHHSDHLMMRVPSSDVYMPKCARKFMYHVARNLKKSAYTASKEAYRAARFAGRSGAPNKPAGEENKAGQPQAEASDSNKAPETQQGCPFKAGEGININDMYALGAMARQHCAPLMDMLSPPAEGNENNPGHMLVDVIRNALDGFFGRPPQNDTSNQQESAEQSQQQSQNEKEPTAQNNNNNNNSAEIIVNPNSQPTPMDMETGAHEEAHVLNGNNASGSAAPQPTDNAQRRDPGWTFIVPPKQPDDSKTNENKPSNQATAPVFIYHENPRIAEGLVHLREMGFSNETRLLTHLLECYEGDVAAVVKAIVDMKIHSN